jgi:hypothetical protein
MARDYEKKRHDLAADYEKKRGALDREEEIAGALPPAVADDLEWMYHDHRLYGHVGSLHVRHNFYDYAGRQPQPTLATVRALAEALPSVEPLILVRDGSLSFREGSHVAALPEAKKERWTEETIVAPFTVKVSGFQHYTYTITWPAWAAGHLIEVSVELPLPFLHDAATADNHIGRLHISYKDIKGGRDIMGGRVVERCEFKPADALIDLFRNHESVAQLQRPIRWASGSPETPNDYTLYWLPLRDWETEPAHRPTVLDLVTAIEGRCPAVCGGTTSQCTAAAGHVGEHRDAAGRSWAD